MPFENYIHSLINRDVFPGISILIGQGNSIIFENHYGKISNFPETVELDENVIYDVASLTKPLITALLVVYLHQEQDLDLQADISRFFPEIKWGGVTIQHLLSHTAGLPPWYPFYLFQPTYLEQMTHLSPQSKSGRKVCYSCVGYILLHYLIEKIAATPFTQLADEILFKPLALKRSGFCINDDLKKFAAPTENGNGFEREMALKKFPEEALPFNWREQMIWGETHDVNSHYQGGTAGNSGLFSTTAELFRLSREFFPEYATLLKPENIQKFWHNFTPRKASHRSLGFKLNSSLITSGGRALSRRAIGHSGFTGTSIWLEPTPGITYILLTNRIHPEVRPINFNRIRRRLHRMLKVDLGLKNS